MEVSLDKGLAAVKLKPGNAVTLKQLQTAITKNGFTMKQTHIVAAGKVIQDSGARFQISGSNDLLTLVPESSSASLPSADGSATFLVEGTIPEAAKGKTPDSVRYRSLTAEK